MLTSAGLEMSEHHHQMPFTPRQPYHAVRALYLHLCALISTYCGILGSGDLSARRCLLPSLVSGGISTVCTQQPAILPACVHHKPHLLEFLGDLSRVYPPNSRRIRVIQGKFAGSRMVLTRVSSQLLLDIHILVPCRSNGTVTPETPPGTQPRT